MSASPAELVRRWVREDIRESAAYPVAEAEGFVKLDAMENPYEWPPDLKSRWLENLRQIEVNRYPHPSPAALKDRLRTVLGLPDHVQVILGNGSDELIHIIALMLAGEDRVMLAPGPTFAMYRITARTVGLRYAEVPLNTDDFSLPPEAMLEAVEKHQPALVFLAYPNNPTGNLFDDKVMCDIIERTPGLVVVDEAYAPFARMSFASELGKYPNLVVMRTVSKLGLAGLRLGLVAGPEAWLAEMDKVRLPYNVNALTQASVAFALEHFDVFTSQTEAIARDRSEMLTRLRALNSVKVWPSAANFLLCQFPKGRGPAIYEALKERKILVKNLQGAHPALADCLRVTIGKSEENNAFLEALAAIL